jgi:two-component system, cell cycle response regulator
MKTVPQTWPEDPESDQTLAAGSPRWGEDRTALRKRSKGEPAGEPCEWVLVIYSGGNMGRMFPLMPGNNVIGRAPSVEITLLDDEISRAHACIRLDAEARPPVLLLEDLGSTNGTFVNGVPVVGPRFLAAGDRIALGDHILKLVAMDPLERTFHSVLLDQSSRDPLTGLGNRRTTIEDLQARFGLGRRHKRALSVIMCDLDHFKRINDTLGHGAGDLVLSGVGERIHQNLRTTDIAGRIGGEEFLLILPETDLEGATLLAERLRVAIGEHPFPLPTGPLTVTASLGVAVMTLADRDGGSLLARADTALYDAKSHGRNRVVAAAAKD